MNVKKLLEHFDEFEWLLREFEKQREALLGTSMRSSRSADEFVSQREQVHYSLDDFRLTLLRKYQRLRPFIQTYSGCFRLASEVEDPPKETYEGLPWEPQALSRFTMT